VLAPGGLMHIQHHPFSIPFILAALVSAGIAATIWRRRSAPGAVSLMVHMLGLALWSGAIAAMWLSTSLHSQLFWLNLSALGVVLIPITFLTFSLQIARKEKYLTRRLMILLTIEPLVGLLLLWTNDSHHLVYSPAQLWVLRGLAELQWSPGLWFRLDAVYMYMVMAIGIGFLVHSMSHNGDLHRWQIKMILAGACLPLIADLIYLSSLSEYLFDLDLSPILFTLSGGLYFYALSQRKFLDLIPVAHSRLIQSMPDGVIVLDLQDRVVEMNPAAEHFLGIQSAQTIGRRAREVLSGWEETTGPFLDQMDIRTEIVIAQDIPRTIDLKITPLIDSKKRSTGRMLVFRDITTRKLDEAALKNVNEQLHEQLDEICTLRDQLHEQAIRDSLTNLFNRRYLEESLAQELARAERENFPVCLIMIDIDKFKRVNDTCGHKVGDEILQALATLIVLHIRRFDVACRFGGEEFVIVMPKLSIETARERAEFLRKEFARMALPCAELKARPTISIGVAAYPFHGANNEQLLHAVDQALYAAKSAGRNRTVVYLEEVSGTVEVR
jgi:diguanylate cyclase (GGDEF)-like protein/PAS domain S-box-containing protein